MNYAYYPILNKVRWVLNIVICLLLALGAFLGWMFHEISESIDAHTVVLTEAFPGDVVEAAISALRSGEYSLSEKGRFVWVLQQVGDARALPVLDSLYTGEECRHGEIICQYELEKARSALRRESFNWEFGTRWLVTFTIWGVLLAGCVVGRWKMRKTAPPRCATLAASAS